MILKSLFFEGIQSLLIVSCLLRGQILSSAAAKKEETIEERQDKIYQDIKNWCSSNGDITGHNKAFEGAITLIVGKVRRREDKKNLIERALSDGAGIDGGVIDWYSDRTPLIQAIAQKDQDIAHFLLERGADPNLSGMICARHNADVPASFRGQKIAPLTLAYGLGCQPTIDLLISAGARRPRVEKKKRSGTCVLL